MRKAGALVLVAIMLGATGCDCELRNGTYQLKWDRVAGDCQTPDDGLVTYDAGLPEWADDCDPNISRSDDFCTEKFDFTCTQSDGSEVRQIGETEWSQDGEEGEERIEVIVTRDGGEICRGVFDLTYELIRDE